MLAVFLFDKVGIRLLMLLLSVYVCGFIVHNKDLVLIHTLNYDPCIPNHNQACKDFHACKWPSQLSSDDVALAHFFDTMNEKNRELIQEIQKNCCQLITFSHFVPR